MINLSTNELIKSKDSQQNLDPYARHYTYINLCKSNVQGQKSKEAQQREWFGSYEIRKYKGNNVTTDKFEKRNICEQGSEN